MLRRFGCVVRNQADVDAAAKSTPDPAPAPTAVRPRLTGTTWALSVAALAWGLINFGLLLWLPANLVAKGYSMAVARQLLVASALIALPTVFAAAFECKRLSRNWQTST
jgi:putative MFS transporter